MLGGIAAATRPIIRDAFAAAILPTVNSMVGMGIVFLPGLMTGQILSGVSPLTAIEYQTAIMLGIVGSVALTVYILLQMGYKVFFNPRVQLRRGGGERLVLAPEGRGTIARGRSHRTGQVRPRTGAVCPRSQQAECAPVGAGRSVFFVCPAE